MAVVHQNEEEVKLEKSNNMAIVPTTLATIESLTFPLVQQVVFLADFRCKSCQDRVADIVARLNVLSLSRVLDFRQRKLAYKSDHNFGSFQDFLISRQPKLTGKSDRISESFRVS